MGEIFISYAHEDRPRASRLAEALSAKGWSVWWDRTIPPGKTFDQVIEEALDSAKCVIVLWSKQSVASHWVKTEAAEGLRRGILVPALIDDVRIPLEFKRIQAAELINWDGESTHPEFDKLVNAAATIVGPPPIVAQQEERRRAEAEAARKAREEERQRDEAEAAHRVPTPGEHQDVNGWRRPHAWPKWALAGIAMTVLIGGGVWYISQNVPQSAQPNEKGSVARGWLGVSTQTITEELAPQLGVKPGQGSLIRYVWEGGAADVAGLEAGDVVVAFAGKPVTDPNELARLVTATTPGSRVPIKIQRQGKDLTLMVVLAQRPTETPAAVPSVQRQGIAVKDLTPELRERLQVEKGKLKSEDVILEVNNQPVQNRRDLLKILRASRPETKLLLLVKRGKKSMFIVVSSPKG